MNCKGRVTVQDYIPRNFHLTFGFDCHLLPIHSLQGLKYNDSFMNSLKSLRYNITFSNQSNETNDCVDYSTQVKTKACNGFYRQTSLPNLFGHEQLDIMREYSTAIQVYEVSMLSHGRCHQHLLEILCHVLLPECDPVTQQVIHPCRETCWALLDACLQTLFSLIANLAPRYDRPWDEKQQNYWSNQIDCNFLPSIHGNITCFYEPVTCGSPPDVTNGTMILNSTQRDVYQLHDVVQYACVNDTYEMTGTDSIKCLYSGQWSQPPPKCAPVNNSGIKFVYFLLPVIFSFLFILFIFIGIKYKSKPSSGLKEERIQLDNTLVQLINNDEPLLPSKRRQESTLSLDSPPSLKRNREFDAFVLYHFDTDDDFVLNVLLPELEENRDFKICIHSRNFTPGRDIKDNICEAIEGSNSAIIVMSQGFVDSMWCKEEFTHCYIENMKDTAFNLFVIMMQPADTLVNISPYMQSYFDTYF